VLVDGDLGFVDGGGGEGISKNNLHANVSSIFTTFLALVSINPHPCLLAHSSPVWLLTCRFPAKSHLFPATILTGGGNRASVSSARASASMSISPMKWFSASSESAFVMSYTRRKASDFRFEEAHMPRYSSWPAVSVRQSW
jgi:hypothetical protein